MKCLAARFVDDKVVHSFPASSNFTRSIKRFRLEQYSAQESYNFLLHPNYTEARRGRFSVKQVSHAAAALSSLAGVSRLISTGGYLPSLSPLLPR